MPLALELGPTAKPACKPGLEDAADDLQGTGLEVPTRRSTNRQGFKKKTRRSRGLDNTAPDGFAPQACLHEDYSAPWGAGELTS